MTARTGAKSRAAIPTEILSQLNGGTLETASLVEQLAVDFTLLLGSVFPDIPVELLQRMESARTLGITKRMAKAGAILADHFGADAFDILRTDVSDTVRGWGAYALAADTRRSLPEKLQKMRALADDPHFSVREWAWLALRNDMAAHIEAVLEQLRPWTESPSENIRRFAVEGTRPRGVWSCHIPLLKQHPARGVLLLDNLMTDPSRYVQSSVANWLNDASKDAPDWVRDYVARWQRISKTNATAYIAKRALRSAEKNLLGRASIRRHRKAR